MGFLAVIFLILYFLSSAIKILREYERGVVFRLGRIIPVKGPGLVIIWPVIDKLVKVGLRVVTMDVPSQDIITRDNITVKVNAVVYFRVIDPIKAITEVEDFLFATSQIAQTTLRSILGQSQLDDLLAKREELNAELQKVIDFQTEPWGIKVTAVEVKNVDLPPEMLRAIAKQAEAERERRAKVIHAEGEFQASQKLADAATIIATAPTAMQLRFLQTLTEIATEKNSTIIFPVPIDLIKPFLEKHDTTKKGLMTRRYSVKLLKNRVWLILLVFLVAGSTFILYETGLISFFLDKERMKKFLNSLGPLSFIGFIFLQASQVIISPIPGEVTGLMGGFLYGKFLGIILSTIGLTAGSWIAFSLSRCFGRPFVEKFVKKETMDRYDYLFHHKGAFLVFLLFLIPGFPKDIFVTSSD